MGLGLVILVLQRCCVGYIVFYSFKALKQPRPSRRIPSASNLGAQRKASQDQAWAKAGGGALTSAQKARRTRIRDMVRCWFIYISYRWLEAWASSTVAWAVPFYDEIHLVWLLFMLFSGTQGPETLFRRLVKPFISPYEKALDSVLGSVHDALQIVMYMLMLPVDTFRRWRDRRAVLREYHARERAREQAPPSRLPQLNLVRPSSVTTGNAAHVSRRSARTRVPSIRASEAASVPFSSETGPSYIPPFISHSVSGVSSVASTSSAGAMLPGALGPPTPVQPLSTLLDAPRDPKPIILGAGADEYRSELAKLAAREAPSSQYLQAPTNVSGEESAVTPSFVTAETMEVPAVDLAADVDSTVIIHDPSPQPSIIELPSEGDQGRPSEVGPQRSTKKARSARKTAATKAIASPSASDAGIDTPRKSKSKGKRAASEAEELKVSRAHDGSDDVILPASLTSASAVKKRRKLAASRSLYSLDVDGDETLNFDIPPTPRGGSKKAPRPSSSATPLPFPSGRDQSMSFSQPFMDLSYRPSLNAAVPLGEDFMSPSKAPAPTGKRKLHNPDEPLPAPLSSDRGDEDAREKTLGSLRMLGSDWDLSQRDGSIFGASRGAAAKKKPRVSALSTAGTAARKPKSSTTAAAVKAKPAPLPKPASTSVISTMRGKTVPAPQVKRAATSSSKAKAGPNATLDDLDLTKLMSSNGNESTFVTNTDTSASTSAYSSKQIGLGRPSAAKTQSQLGSRSETIGNGLAVPRPRVPSVSGGLTRSTTTNGLAGRKASRATLGEGAPAQAGPARSVSTKVFPGGKSAATRPIGSRKGSVSGA